LIADHHDSENLSPRNDQIVGSGELKIDEICLKVLSDNGQLLHFGSWWAFTLAGRFCTRESLAGKWISILVPKSLGRRCIAIPAFS